MEQEALTNTLMWSDPMKVCNIPIEHALEVLLVKDQQVVEAFLSHTPGEAFADRIGSGSMIGCFENLNCTRSIGYADQAMQAEGRSSHG
jgi:hypothetical protein